VADMRMLIIFLIKKIQSYQKLESIVGRDAMAVHMLEVVGLSA
jgi:hypothetical protein